jgi:hypothetical protein
VRNKSWFQLIPVEPITTTEEIAMKKSMYFVIMFVLCFIAANAVANQAQQVTPVQVASLNHTGNESSEGSIGAVTRTPTGGVTPAGSLRSNAIVEGSIQFSGMGPHNELALDVCGVGDTTCWGFASTMMEVKLRSTPFDFRGSAMQWMSRLHLYADINYYGGHNVPQKEYHTLSMGPLAVEKTWSVSFTLPKKLGEAGFTQHPPLDMLQNFSNSPTYHASAEAMGGRYNSFWIKKTFSIGGPRGNSQ